jgi:hypothetical protein
VLENGVLRRILEPKADEITGGLRTFHNEESYNFHPFPNIIIMVKSRRMRWARNVACVGVEYIQIFVKRPPGRP